MLRYSVILIFILSIFLCLENSCQLLETSPTFFNKTVRDSVAQKYVSQQIEQELKKNEVVATFKTRDADFLKKEFANFYKHTNNQLGWQNVIARGLSEQAKVFIEMLQNAENQGLISEKYHLSEIKKLADDIYAPFQPERENQVEQMTALDIKLTASAISYLADIFSGSIKGGYKWEYPSKQQAIGEPLIKAIRYGGIEKMAAGLSPTHKGFVGLQEKVTQYRKIAENGGWSKISSNLGKENVAVLAKRLADMNDLAADKANATSFNADMKEAVKKYQKRHNFPVSGSLDAMTLKSLNEPIEDKIKTMQLNMERYRWLPHADSLGKRYVWVNIPEFMIKVYDAGKQVADIVAVVGEYKNATPILIDRKLMNVIFSPVWNVPLSIAEEEMEYILKNPAVLIVADIDVFVDGKEVDPRNVDWENTSRSRIRMKQKPKKSNSMGEAKFMFQNNHSIFLHDTPNQHDFKNRIRSASHGCVRVAEPKRLAVELLKGGNWNSGNIHAAMKKGKETYARLPQDVRVHIFYLTSWVDDEGVLQFRKDIYGHDKRHRKSLQASL